MSDLKACSRCGRIHPRGFYCGHNRKYSDKHDDQAAKLRSSWAWTVKAQQIKDDAQGLCEVCRDHNKLTYDDLEVHHIVKVSEDNDKLLEDRNLICLCVRHHKQADRGYLDPVYLSELAYKRIRRVQSV